MKDILLSRRTALQLAGASVLGTLGLSRISMTASAHEQISASAETLLPPLFIPAKPEDGFNYPYYLYAPKPTNESDRPIMVQPNNTGQPTDNFTRHREAAEGVVDNDLPRLLSDAMHIPLVVPVFPRPESEPVSGLTYIQYLDTNTLKLDDGPLERVDLQLLAMVDHARNLLRELDVPLNDKIMLNGFSATGNFVNRFTALHPDKVQSVSAGAFNGTAILPIEEAKGHTLNYQIGIADLEELTGEPFDEDSFVEVPQLLYMGTDDENDTIPFEDAWGYGNQREIALDVYGEDMQEDRVPYCESVYEDIGADAEFKLYDGVGHEQSIEIQEDILDFHEAALGISQIAFHEPPVPGDEAVSVEGIAWSNEQGTDLEARVFIENGDITEAAATLTDGESYHRTIALTDELDETDAVTAAILPSGEDNLAAAITTTTIDLDAEASITILSGTEPGSSQLTVEYAIPPKYAGGSQIHIYLETPSERRIFLTTDEAGVSTTENFDVSGEADDIPFSAGQELRVSLRDIDVDETIADQTITVEESTGLEGPASVEFESHPLHDETEVEVAYSLDADYDVQGIPRLELKIGDGSPILLSRLNPGDETSSTFNFDHYPLQAAEDATLSVTDDTILAQTQRLVLVREPDEGDSTTPTPTPTPDDPTPTPTPTLTSDEDGIPGPGIVGTVGSLVGAGYVLKWWSNTHRHQEE